MPKKLAALLPAAYQNLLLAILAGLAYDLSFLLNRAQGSSILYDNWIALVFIPAGIKHLFILVARGWVLWAVLRVCWCRRCNFGTTRPFTRSRSTAP